MQEETTVLNTIAASGSTGFISKYLVTEIERKYRILLLQRSDFLIYSEKF